MARRSKATGCTATSSATPRACASTPRVSRIGAEDFDGFVLRARDDVPPARRLHAGHRPDAAALGRARDRRHLREPHDRGEGRRSSIASAEQLTGSDARVNVEWADIDDAFGNNQYLIVSLPSKLDYDGRDNKLDPTEGLRGTLDAEPLAEFERGTLALVAQGTLSGYSAFGDERPHGARRRAARSARSSAATPRTFRRRGASILGGGGSIRGYEYRIGRAGGRTARWSAASPSSRRRSSSASA